MKNQFFTMLVVGLLMAFMVLSVAIASKTDNTVSHHSISLNEYILEENGVECSVKHEQLLPPVL